MATPRNPRATYRRLGLAHPLAFPPLNGGASYTGLVAFLRTDRRRLLRVLPHAGVKLQPLRYRRGYYPFSPDECERVMRAFYIALDVGIINASKRNVGRWQRFKW